jgi:hypothetical protein
MKYLFLLYGPDRPFPQPGTGEFREMLEAWTTGRAPAYGCGRPGTRGYDRGWPRSQSSTSCACWSGGKIG